jgi:hypothetical protein
MEAVGEADTGKRPLELGPVAARGVGEAGPAPLDMGGHETTRSGKAAASRPCRSRIRRSGSR